MKTIECINTIMEINKNNKITKNEKEKKNICYIYKILGRKWQVERPRWGFRGGGATSRKREGPRQIKAPISESEH